MWLLATLPPTAAEITPLGNKDKHDACPLGDTQCPIFDEIRQLRAEVSALSDQVRTDHLTGLYNKRHLIFALEQEIERTKRTQHPTTFVMLDIDHFKQFNDTYGHVQGDHALTHLASIIKSTIRKLDIPCRYGGEEFGVLFPSTTLLVGVQVAERVRSAIESSPITIEGSAINITASLGVDSFLPSHNDTVSEFIDRTDKQLYEAKQSGRNQVKYSSTKEPSKTQVSDAERDSLFNFPDDEE